MRQTTLFFYHISFLLKTLSCKIHKITFNFLNQTYIQLFDTNDLLFVINFLKKSSLYNINILFEHTATDSVLLKRFSLYYFFLSSFYNNRLYITVPIYEYNIVHSISKIYSSSIWLEREVYDMFGIFYKNHPDFRRILTDYGFENHPLRKEFPLTGFEEVFYQNSSKNIEYFKIELMQSLKFTQ
jgi:NADH-quinone oxidoreductase subunit C